MRAPAPPEALAHKAVDTIKMLSVDAVEKANSGHPGLPMGAADFAFVLWYRYLRFDPKDPKWPNRDRFVLSAGHGSMLLYSLLHLNGFDVTLDDLKAFRQWGSKTPGHPEAHETPGVEVTTGPLGQGFANAVGLALGERLMAAQFNTKEHALYDHRVYCLASDGDLMEGISHEAASLAGHLGLGNLVTIFDDNQVTLAGPTGVICNDDVVKRFEGYGWFVQRADGHDHAAVAQAIDAALAQGKRPSLIAARTHIGNGAPHLHDSYKVHGSPLGKEETLATKRAIGWPEQPTFLVPPEVRQLFEARVAELRREHEGWNALRDAWAKKNPEKAKLWQARLEGAVPAGLFAELVAKLPAPAPAATRALAGQVEQLVAERVPALMGGAADLEPSTDTTIKAAAEVQPDQWEGRNVRFGIREHAMGGALNGLAQYGGFIPFGATFLVFSDYMRPAVRLAALGGLHTIYVWTHDSVLLGEDGPTHQPVEQLGALRLIPNLDVFRPADALEVAAAWTHAVSRKDGPTALVLSRQKLPPIVRPAGFDPELTRRGGYVVSAPPGTPDLVLMATGSELHVVAAAAELLAQEGRRCQVVSLPCLELFERQELTYREQVLPRGVRRLSLEAGRSEPWLRWVGDGGLALGIDRFGASAPDKVIAEKLGLTPAAVAARARAWLAKS
ncbi:MAG: transketolase [Myxococcales bacterium]